MYKLGTIIILILTLLYIPTKTFAELLPPSISILDPITPVKLYFNDDTGYRDAEITPWTLENHKLGGNYLYLVTSYNTHLCDDVDNIFTPTIYKKITNCKLRQSSKITPTNLTSTTGSSLWSRDYYGAFSGHFINTNNQGLQIFAINHGELLNNNYFSSLPQNCVLAPDIGYGTFPCTPENNGKSYNAFVGMSTFAWNLANFNSDNTFVDSGPIVWPANGYVDNGQKATSLGILHPSSLITNSTMYVFFRDTSIGTIAGRTSGLKVARAPITATGVDPLSFKTYFQGNFVDNALPTGFDKNQIMNFFSQKGGRSSALFANDTSLGNPPDVYSFSAAKITGTNTYLGVSQDLFLGVTLRLSHDLVNWSKQIVLPGTEFNYFGPNGGNANFIKQPFMYPRLANADGDSNQEIDPNNFYVIGTSDGVNPFNTTQHAKIVNQIHLKLNNIAGDANGDVIIDGKDYTIWLNNFGTNASGPANGNFNNDNIVDSNDYLVWTNNYEK